MSLLPQSSLCRMSRSTPGISSPRYVKFQGRMMRHGGMSPTWHLRLFRSGVGRCEDRKYDQHFLLAGPGTTGQLPGVMIDDIAMSISEWTARHNRWADGEVAEMDSSHEEGRLVADSKGNPAQRKRALREKYNNMPLFIRPFALFGYRYFFKLGFLDGTEGFIFWVAPDFLVSFSHRRKDMGEAPYPLRYQPCDLRDCIC